jgi:hypothetical protein
MGKYCIVFLVSAGLLLADNLLTNGDFEQELDVGWQQSMTANGVIDRATTYDQDQDYEAKVYQYESSGYTILYQEIGILSVDLPVTGFSCKAKMNAYSSVPSDWAAAAVIVSYMDESSTVLGETRITYRTVGCPWTSTSTMHIIDVPDVNWQDFSFNLNDELTTNLLGVNPAEIGKIRISLYDTLIWCGG